MRTVAHSGAEVLAARAREAPTRPGAYVLLGADTELLYIGKAANLRRRLLDHARATTGARLRAAHVAEVRWVECADEHDASCLEADLIVALAPRFNAVMVDDSYTFICLERTGDRIRLRLSEEEGGDRTYGAFPHLGKGKHSWRAVRTNCGFSALLRLLWVAFGADDVRFRLPSTLRGSSPPVDRDMPLDRSRLPVLHDFLSGRSNRLARTLREAVAAEDVPAFMRRPLLRDLDEAAAFYRLGPRALRQLRLRHDLRPGPVDRDTFAHMVGDDLRRAIGDFKVSVAHSRARVRACQDVADDPGPLERRRRLHR